MIDIGKLTRYHLSVDYSLTLKEMIASGQYRSSSPEHNNVGAGITEENYPIVPGEAEVDVVLLHPEPEIPSKYVFRVMAELGVRPATLPELLAFGSQHPLVEPPSECAFSGVRCILALGSTCASDAKDQREWECCTLIWTLMPWGPQWNVSSNYTGLYLGDNLSLLVAAP